MKISLGADHAGFELKDKLKQNLVQRGYEVIDQGTCSSDSVDYPDFARKVAEQVAAGDAHFGILICGTGIGMSMAANKVRGIRATNATHEWEVQMCREHNDANVLCLGARILDEAAAQHLVDKFLHTAFAGGRHQRRVDKIMQIENEQAQAAKAR